jgi:hypothetical protein
MRGVDRVRERVHGGGCESPAITTARPLCPARSFATADANASDPAGPYR